MTKGPRIMNSSGAAGGETPRPWWRSRTRHDRLRRDAAQRERLARLVHDFDYGQKIKEDMTMVVGQDMQPGDLSGERYRGVPVPGNIRDAARSSFHDDPYVTGWRDGVDAALTRDRDTDTSGGRTVSPEVSAFEAVTNGDRGTARDIVSRMSGRDRAVLSFWMGELGDIVSALETERRWP